MFVVVEFVFVERTVQQAFFRELPRDGRVPRRLFEQIALPLRKIRYRPPTFEGRGYKLTTP